VKIDDEICAVHVRISHETELALKAIARKEQESLATIIRASLRQTVLRGGVETAFFAGVAPSVRESAGA
jgi:predicted transcriptional regulator